MVATAQQTLPEKPATRTEGELSALYERAFPAVAKFVSNRGGNLEQARDLFHDALVAYLEGQHRTEPRIRISETAYVLGIARHFWFKKHRYDRREMPLGEAEQHLALTEDFYPDVQEKRLLRLLELTGKKCLDLLRAFYYQRLPMKKLMQSLGYSSEHVASVQKYKCLEKVRKVVKAKSMTYEDFTE